MFEFWIGFVVGFAAFPTLTLLALIAFSLYARMDNEAARRKANG